MSVGIGVSGSAAQPAVEPYLEAEVLTLPTEGRRELRAARKRRQRISLACALLVAACTAVTLLMVALAR